MNDRGKGAIAAAGLDIDALLSTPGAQLAAVRDQVLGRGDALPAGDHSAHSGPRLLTVHAERPRVIGSRQAFVRALLALVERAAAGAAATGAARKAAGAGSSAGSLEFVWGASLESLDLAARTATFQKGAPDGSTAQVQDTQQYDLLVAADGFASRCRRAAEAQAGGELAVRMVPPNRQYKVWARGRVGSVLSGGGGGAEASVLCCSKLPLGVQGTCVPCAQTPALLICSSPAPGLPPPDAAAG